MAKLDQASDSPMLIMNEAQAESFEQENLLRLHYSRGFAWVFRQVAERDPNEEIAARTTWCGDIDQINKPRRSIATNLPDKWLGRRTSFVRSTHTESSLTSDSKSRRTFAANFANRLPGRRISFARSPHIGPRLRSDSKWRRSCGMS